MIFGLLVIIVFMALIVVVVVWTMRWFHVRGAGVPKPSEDNALEILKERYAQGEIDKEEYERRRRILRGDSPSQSFAGAA